MGPAFQPVRQEGDGVEIRRTVTAPRKPESKVGRALPAAELGRQCPKEGVITMQVWRNAKRIGWGGLLGVFAVFWADGNHAVWDWPYPLGWGLGVAILLVGYIGDAASN